MSEMPCNGCWTDGYPYPGFPTVKNCGTCGNVKCLKDEAAEWVEAAQG